MQTLRSGKAVPEICAAAELSKDALALLAGANETRTFVEKLVEKEAWPDAIAFLAHAFPRREGVWWALLCAREAAGEPAKPPLAASLEATKAWITEPTDPHRQAALDAAQLAGIASPAGMAGLAAFLCGESLGPASAPPAPPPEYAAAKAIAGCVNLSAVDNPEADVAAMYAELVRRGIELADRINLWTPDTAAAPNQR